MQESLAHLERAVRAYDVHEPQQQTATSLEAFLSLDRRVEDLANSLQKEI